MTRLCMLALCLTLPLGLLGCGDDDSGDASSDAASETGADSTTDSATDSASEASTDTADDCGARGAPVMSCDLLTNGGCGIGQLCVADDDPCGSGSRCEANPECALADCAVVQSCDEISCNEGETCAIAPDNECCAGTAICQRDGVDCPPPSSTCDELDCRDGSTCVEIVGEGGCVTGAECSECDSSMCGRPGDCSTLSCNEDEICREVDEVEDCCPIRAKCFCNSRRACGPSSCAELECGAGQRCEMRSGECCDNEAVCVSDGREPSATPTCYLLEESALADPPTRCSDDSMCEDGERCGERRYADRLCPTMGGCEARDCAAGTVCVETPDMCGTESRCVSDCRTAGCESGQTCRADGLCREEACTDDTCQCLCLGRSCSVLPKACLPSER